MTKALRAGIVWVNTYRVVSPIAELLIVKFNVTTLSQPLIVCRVSVYDPVDVYVLPYQTKLSQAVALVSLDAAL